MSTLNITISKSGVYDEVAKTTAYIGKKMKGDANAYERIFVTDADRMLLERYWREACSSATGAMKDFVTSVVAQPESHGVDLSKDYSATLTMPSNWDATLADSINASLFAFFVASIVAEWSKISNKEEAEAYANDAVAAMKDVRIKLYYRTRPTRKS